MIVRIDKITKTNTCVESA